MKIEIVGAGPAGLCAAILACRHLPRVQVRVWDTRTATQSLGFGLVFSDDSLAEIAQWDSALAQSIAHAAVHWNEIELQFKEQWLTAAGHGFVGIGRDALLHLLAQRAGQEGAVLRFGASIDADALQTADVVVVADGSRSALRAEWAPHFGSRIDTHVHAFAWLEVDRQLPAFRYSFRRNEHGVWLLHAYPHASGVSTLVVEAHPATLVAAGLAEANGAQIASTVQALFGIDLMSGQVKTQGGGWRRFHTVRNEHWHHANRVLIGDAAHTAHFSVGSGARLALADAAALIDALRQYPIDHALAAYQAQRAPVVGRMQKVAQVSRQWFETLPSRWDMDPLQMQVSLLTRAKRMTYDSLQRRDPGLIARATCAWHARHRDETMIQPATASQQNVSTPPMFAPFRLRSLQLINRVVVSPMAQYSAVDGCPTDWHLVHYGSRAVGGAGLILTEMTCVVEQGRITPGCTGLYRADHVEAWRRIVEFVHTHSGARIGVQLGHAGRKGSTRLGWEGMDQPLPEGNWPLMSASELPYLPGTSQSPRAMDRADMDGVIAAFEASVSMADQAGFDLIELHMAHGYLLASFLSPITNRRADAYGGSPGNRMRFPLEVFEAVRARWPAHKPIAIRLSAADWMPGGNTEVEAVEIARTFKAAGVDLIDVSSGQTDPQSRPEYGRMYQAAFSEAIRLQAGVPTIAVGAIADADQVNTLLLSGRADLVALGRPHLEDPYFSLRAAVQYGHAAQGWPAPYAAGAESAIRRATAAKK